MPKAPETAVLQPFPEATTQFEDWMRTHIAVRENDLEFKHEQMVTGPFPFMRATFYRWIQLWPVLCPELAGAPHVLAVGDLYADNFATWRDQEGRLIWGVNPLLRREAGGVLRDPVRFWQRLNAQPEDREPPEPLVRRPSRSSWLARAMGAETANIHLGAAAARIEDVRRDLATRPEGWLRSASKVMTRATVRDFEAWLRWRGQPAASATPSR